MNHRSIDADSDAASPRHRLRNALGRASTALVWAAGVLSALAFVRIFHLSPLNGEDYALTAVFDGIGWAERLAWIVDRALLQAREWNARLGEMLAILWLSLPRTVFTLVASLSFVAFAHLLGQLAPVGRRSFARTLLALALVFALWPGMELFFWRTVHAGYFQPLVLTLGCMALYRDAAAVERLRDSLPRCAAACVLGLLAGVSFENTPVALVIFLLASLALTGRGAWSVRTLAPVAATALGWLALVTAPSTTHRRQFYAEVFAVPEFGIDYLLRRIDNVWSVFWGSSPALFVLSLVALVWLCASARRSEVLRVLLLVVTAALVVASVVAAPYTEPRAFSLAWALMFAIVVGGVHYACERAPALRPLAAAAALWSLGTAWTVHGYYADFAARIAQRDRIIAAQASTPACESGIVVDEIRAAYPYRYLNNRDQWVRTNPAYMRMYYGCAVRVE